MMIYFMIKIIANRNKFIFRHEIRVALARKIAVIYYRMMTTKEAA